MAAPLEGFDFIVVGSGAGGGVLASRLARNDQGLKVLLIDAGSDPRQNQRFHYQVPAFHALATEDPDLRWDFFVDHFTDPDLARQDEKQDKLGRGIFYPRASAIGGCTAHHAMITVYPDPSDWDDIADLTGDDSWRGGQMWGYFDRCRERAGFRWLTIEAAGIDAVLRAAKDVSVDEILLAAVRHAPHLARQLWRASISNIVDLFALAKEPVFDPNHHDCVYGDREGLYRIPLSTKDGKRQGVTEFIYDTKAHPTYGRNLTIWENTLVTKVIFNNDRAQSVQYVRGERAYRADRDGRGDHRDLAEFEKKLKTVSAAKEIILAAGAFNTPQLLMNSGVGPEAHLTEKGVRPIAKRPGVGRNLQDRYEIPVIDDLDHEFELLRDYAFTGGGSDKGFQLWNKCEGFYTTNGGTIGIMRRSGRTPGPNCDLLIFGIPGEFGGYQLNYSERIRTPDGRSRFSWIILKAHTNNRGEVRLRTTDPRDQPAINFKNFGDGKRKDDPDLLALEWGVRYVRDFMRPLRNRTTTARAGAWGRVATWLQALIRLLRHRVTEGEFLPGVADPELRNFIMTRAWGHHASCTCAIGKPTDADAVLDSEFRVIDAPGGNLRVVDASVFPKIPGYFIVLPIYLIAEKAADVILTKYNAHTMPV
jgi:choline dehydrogenase